MQRLTRTSVRLLIVVLLAPASAVLGAITASVVPSRTSGVAPLAVYFDASATTATGVEHPMHALHYEWNFGDPSAGAWSISGRSKNTATSFAAAHVFTKPGTYKVALQVRQLSGETASKTVTITVEDPDVVFARNDTVCFSPDGDFAGAPKGAELVKTDSLATVMSYLANNRRLLLKRGARFSGGNLDITTDGPGIIGSFGPDKAPPRLTGSSNYFRFRSSDWRILDLEFEGASAPGNAAMEAHAPAQDLLVMNTRSVPNTLHRMFSGAISFPDKLFIVENDWRDFGFGNGGVIIYTLSKRLAILGNHLEDAIGGEHIVRLVQCEKGVVSHNYFAKPRATKALLTIRAQDKGETHEVIVSDNIFVSHGDQHLNTVSTNNSRHTVYGRDFIVERNFFKGDPTSDRAANRAYLIEWADNVTMRNNVILFNGWGYRGVTMKTANNVWIYNNSAYSSDTSSNVARFVHSESGKNHTAQNNLWFAPGITRADPIVEGGEVVSNNLHATKNPYAAATITEPAHFRIHAASEALRTGAPVPVFDDFTGARRDLSKPSVGAFESQTTPAKR